MTKQHYKRSPSAAKRWLNCPGSLKLSVGRKNRESVYAGEGSEAHAVAEEALRTKQRAYLVSENKEVADVVQVYLDDIERVKSQYTVISEYIEQTVQHSTIEGFGGTPDHAVVYDDNGTLVLHIWDYKHGVGIVVDAEENEQMLSYFSILGSNIPFIEEYRVTIVQPRIAGEKIKYWSCTPEHVAKFTQRVIDTDNRTDEFNPGEYCNFCPALAICKVVQDKAFEFAYTVFDDVREDVDKLLEIQKLQPAINALFREIPIALLEAYRKNPIEGYKVIRGTTHRKWKDPEEVVVALQERGLNEEIIFEPRSIRSPAQIEAELGKGSISDLCYSPPGQLKVVPESSRGKPVEPHDTLDIRDMF